MDLEEAHKHSSNHKNELKESEVCGCFYCCKTFKYEDITYWCYHGKDVGDTTACCPYCDIDSVIGSKSGFPIEKTFLKQMKKRWFDQ